MPDINTPYEATHVSRGDGSACMFVTDDAKDDDLGIYMNENGDFWCDRKEDWIPIQHTDQEVIDGITARLAAIAADLAEYVRRLNQEN